METDNPFEKVLDRLREKGWHQGSYHKEWDDVDSPACIRGAAIDTKVCSAYYYDLLEPIIEDNFPDRRPLAAYGSITVWFNDHPDTTFADVERVLEKAAVKWEEERVLRD